MWFRKGHDLESSRSWVKINGTVRFHDLNNIHLDAKIIILSALVQKLTSKTSFCIMVANVTHVCMSHVQAAQDIFLFIARPGPKLHCVKIWWWFAQQEPRYGPKYDFTVLWPWKVKVIHEGQQVFLSDPRHLHISTDVKFHWNLILSVFSYSLSIVDQKVARRKKEERQNMTETLWLMLTFCDANYVMKERPDIKVTRQ